MTIEEINELKQLSEMLRQENRGFVDKNRELQREIIRLSGQIQNFKDANCHCSDKALLKYQSDITEKLDNLARHFSSESQDVCAYGVYAALGALLTIDIEGDWF